MMAPDGGWLSSGLILVLTIAGLVFWAWVVIAPIIITIQLSGVNKKLQQMLDAGQRPPGN